MGAGSCALEPHSPGHTPNSELTEPSYRMDEPPRYSASPNPVSSAEAAAAEPLDGSSATVQLAGGDSEVSAAARLGGSGQGVRTAPAAARLLALPTEAQAACTHQRRRRWDVMPENLSPGTASAQHPSGSEALGIPAHSSGLGVAQPVRAEITELLGSRALPAEADRQQQHIVCSQLLSADSRQDVSEAASQQQRQDGCTNTLQVQQSKKRSRTGSQHSQHTSCSSRSRRNHKHGRGRHHSRPDAGLAVDKQCVDGSRIRYYQTHDEHVHCIPEDNEPSRRQSQVCSQYHSAAGRVHASQDDRWQMWHPQDV